MKSRTRLSGFTFTFHFHALKKEMVTRSSVLAWRIPGTGEPGGLLFMGSHRVRHNWSDLAVATGFLYNSSRVMVRIQFSSVAPLCPTLCNPMDCSTAGLPVHHQLSEFTKTHVHWVSDAIQTSHPLLSPSSPAFSLSQHQGLFKWVSSSHQMAKILEFQLQHQFFQWTLRTDLL